MTVMLEGAQRNRALSSIFFLLSSHLSLSIGHMPNVPNAPLTRRWSFCWGLTYPLWISHVYNDGDHYTLHLLICSIGYSP